SDPLSALTKRELDVLQEVAVGMKNKQRLYFFCSCLFP
ncbi:LuxR C-terminal-related transcriptional regulator, partial [Proteus mirabilis]